MYHTSIYVIFNALPLVFCLLLPLFTLFLASKVSSLSNPVYSLLCLIAVFFQTVVFYLVIGAEFLAFVFLIVYVGAIAILFLFVIMLLNVKELAGTAKKITSRFQAFLILLLSSFSINFILFLSFELENFFLLQRRAQGCLEVTSAKILSEFISVGYQDIFLFSFSLYTYYSFLFVLLSFLLLTSMVGAIVLATSTFES